MMLGGAFITSEKSRDGGPAIAVHFNDDGVIILCFQADQIGRFEMLDGIG